MKSIFELAAALAGNIYKVFLSVSSSVVLFVRMTFLALIPSS